MLTEKQKRLCMSVHEIAEELGLSDPIAYEIVNRADFPAIRYGRRWIIPREAFEKWLMDTVADGQAIIESNSKTK